MSDDDGFRRTSRTEPSPAEKAAVYRFKLTHAGFPEAAELGDEDILAAVAHLQREAIRASVDMDSHLHNLAQRRLAAGWAPRCSTCGAPRHPSFKRTAPFGVLDGAATCAACLAAAEAPKAAAA